MKYIALIFILCASSSVFSGIQTRTFDPKTQKFYGGLGSSAWWSDSPALCGIDIGNDCWGHTIGYVKESTPAGEMVCSTLLAAKAAKAEVDYVLDVTSQNQCEIIQVKYK